MRLSFALVFPVPQAAPPAPWRTYWWAGPAAKGAIPGRAAILAGGTVPQNGKGCPQVSALRRVRFSKNKAAMAWASSPPLSDGTVPALSPPVSA